MSTINQRQLTLARRVAQKLVVSGGLSDAAGLGPSPITHPVPIGGTLGQIVPQRVSVTSSSPSNKEGRLAHQPTDFGPQRPADTDIVAGTGGAWEHSRMMPGCCITLQVTAATQDAADREMAQLLAEAYDDVLETLQRNRTALDKTVSTLLEQTTMSGQQVRMTGHLAGHLECATDCTASSGEQQVVKGGVRVHFCIPAGSQ